MSFAVKALLDPTALWKIPWYHGLPCLTLFADEQIVFPEGCLVSQLFPKAPWSVTTAALNLSDDEWESQLNCLLCICVFMTYRKQTPSWLSTLLAVSSSCACIHHFWLWISGKPRLESSGLPSKTFEMLQKSPARDAATRSLVNGNILYSWSIVKRVKWTSSSREDTAWIVMCSWWLLSQP